MIRWAWKTLFRERGILAASVGGVAGAFFLALVMEAVFAGEAERIVAYLEHADADVWVMQDGVSNVHMATSMLGRKRIGEVRQVPGVAGVEALLYVNAFVETEGADTFSYVVGLSPESRRAGPWAMARGDAIPGPGEAVIPVAFARRAGIELGDPVEILDRRFRVVGLSAETFSMANSVTFVSRKDLGELLDAPEGASYLLVTADPHVDPATLAQRIRTAVPDTNAVPKSTLVANDRALAMQMGTEIIRIMTWIGSTVGALIVAFTVYASTVRRSPELGVAKAVGARNRRLYTAVAFQALLVTALGYAVAAVLAAVARPGLHVLVPEISLRFEPASVAGLGGFAAAVAVVASFLPARRVALLDPMMVFRR